LLPTADVECIEGCVGPRLIKPDGVRANDNPWPNSAGAPGCAAQGSYDDDDGRQCFLHWPNASPPAYGRCAALTAAIRGTHSKTWYAAELLPCCFSRSYAEQSRSPDAAGKASTGQYMV
jgi:hypothetical protein